MGGPSNLVTRARVVALALACSVAACAPSSPTPNLPPSTTGGQPISTPPPPSSTPEDGGLAPDTQTGGGSGLQTDCDPVTAPLPTMSLCRTCHIAGGVAETPTFLLTNNPAEDNARLLDSWGMIQDDMLLIPAEVGGKVHGGGRLIYEGSAEYIRFQTWLDAVEQAASCSSSF